MKLVLFPPFCFPLFQTPLCWHRFSPFFLLAYAHYYFAWFPIIYFIYLLLFFKKILFKWFTRKWNRENTKKQSNRRAFRPSQSKTGKIENSSNPFLNLWICEWCKASIYFQIHEYSQLLDPPSKSGAKGEGFDVQKFGDGRVALIGFPSVGKSTLLSAITQTQSEQAAYEFTTLTCIPGIIEYNDAKIQLLDLPGIIEGASEGRGRGRQVSKYIFLKKEEYK